jgi:hypothetical protein
MMKSHPEQTRRGVKNMNEGVQDYRLTPKMLRKNAKSICEAVKADTAVVMYQCDHCGKLHIRFIDRDESSAEMTSEIID